MEISLFLVLLLKIIQTSARKMYDLEKFNNEDVRKVATKIRKEIESSNTTYVAVEDNGNIVNLSLKEYIPKSPRSIFSKNTISCNFLLYTSKNPNVPQNLTLNPKSLKKSNLNVKVPTKLLIHGWKGSPALCLEITTVYLEKYDYNLISMDWSRTAQSKIYPLVVLRTKYVGDYAGRFIKSLMDYGVNIKDIHIIGHSLGAHIAGFSQENLPGKVSRITGLDPALPGFHFGFLKLLGGEGRLSTKHADFVDIFHTTGGTLGFFDPIGHVDLYVNGGKRQPGCKKEIIYPACSHDRAYNVYEGSIKFNLTAKLCNTNNEMEEHTNIPLGEATPTAARGDYCIYTQAEAPYLPRKNAVRIPKFSNFRRSNNDISKPTPKSYAVKYKPILFMQLIFVALSSL